MNKSDDKVFKLKDIPRMSLRKYSYETGNATNIEEFADEKWNLDIHYYVTIEVKLLKNGYRTQKLTDYFYKFKKINITRSDSIIFSIKNTPGESLNWYWKIRNVGSVAIQKDCIRGNMEKGEKTKEEDLRFIGPHFVEVYGVTNKSVKAFGRVNVPFVQ